jgi:dipeptidyl-peptidase-3
MRAIRSARYLCLITLALPVVSCQREQASSAPAATAADAPSTATPSAPAAAPAERKYLLEKVEDAAIVQLYADGFAALPLRERTLIYHLTQAAIAGRDIFYDQKHRDALAMRSVLEAILTSSKGVDPTTLSGILTYTKLFWINNGPYNNLTAQKFVLPITPEAFVAAARQASSNGARFPTTAGESLDALLARLQPMFFNPDVDPVVTSKTPPPGEDILSASANNLYSGVRMRDLKGFTERYALNSRLVKTGSGLAEEVYRIEGRYGAQIAAIVRHLEAAVPFAPPSTAAALRALIQYYRTGEEADRMKYDIAWVQDKDSPVDTINGFIEVYLDARGVKGAYEGVVFYVNQEKTARIRSFAANAQWFEDRMPYDPKFRKASVRGIVANAIDVVVETGDAGPVTPVGINLPNDQRIREEYGSKSISLTNVSEASTSAIPASMRGEFSWSPAEAERGRKHGVLANELLTDMHEVIGHASGQQAPGTARLRADALGEHASALEEARADLVGLYFTADPKLVELGVVSAADHADLIKAQYESYARNALVQLRRVRKGTQIEDDHMRNRQMIVNWLLANTKAIAPRRRDGKTYYEVVDTAAFREGSGRLLAEVQRIKSEGDYRAAKALFDKYGIQFDPKLRDEVIARVDRLALPSYMAFVMPKLTAVRGGDGQITDVTISYPLDFEQQMLEWSGARTP